MKKKAQGRAFFPPQVRKQAEREIKTTKGPSCQPLPVLIKQRVHTPTPSSSKMLCTQQELLHSTLQLSLQRTGSLRKCQQPTGAEAPALPSPAPRQHRHQREAARTFPGPSSGGRDPRMTRSSVPATAADPPSGTRLPGGPATPASATRRKLPSDLTEPAHRCSLQCAPLPTPVLMLAAASSDMFAAE